MSPSSLWAKSVIPTVAMLPSTLTHSWSLHSVQRYCSHADEHVTQAADSTSGPSALGGLHDPQLRARVQWGDHAGPVGSLEDTGSLGQQGLLSSD